jgi:RNA polymerase sigma-70 factor (ECF subfamily)
MNPNEITPEAFLSIHDEMADSLFRFAYLRVGNREDAVDIVQTTFTRAWSHIRQGKEVPQPKAFLFKIARNLIIDSYRRTKTASLEVLSEDEGFEPIDEQASNATIASSEWRLVEDALATLSPTDRDAIVMRFVEGRMPKEIAQITGLSENVVSVRINRAVERLKRIVRHEQQ